MGNRVAGIAALLLASISLSPAQQTVWFTPVPFGQHPVGVFGSVDYMSLFTPSAPWQQAAARVKVFKVYTDGLDVLSDADLTTMFADLKRRNIALALEFPVLTVAGCGAGIEGFGGNIGPYVQRIRNLGGTLGYLAMQQPFQWGSLYAGANSCRWTAQQVAQNALQQINRAKEVFPNVQVGDIMAVPPFRDIAADWAAKYGDWFDTWARMAGTPLAFFDVDVDWTVPNWQAAVAQIQPVAVQRRIPLAIVYNGFLTDESDAAWMAAAERHFIDYEIRGGNPPPDHVHFQSWNPHPTRVLPETDPNAFTYLINRYFRARTQLTLVNSGTQLSGTLRSNSSPVPGAAVQLTAQPRSGSGGIATYTITGIAPAQARTALVGLRVNSECYNCNGPVDMTVYGFQYAENNRTTATWDFAGGMAGWGFSGPPAFDSGPPPYTQGLRVAAQAGQPLSLNSRPVPVTGGAQFTLTITARVAPVSTGNGYFTMIWFNAAGNEPSREYSLFQPQTVVLGTATTNADGSFSLNNPVDSNAFKINAEYAGSSMLWPAIAAPSAGPLIAAVVNAASFGRGGIAPGQIVTIGGTGIGPAVPVNLQLDPSGRVATSLGGVQVLFNGTPAPLTYVGAGQINAVAPYEIAGTASVSVQVRNQGLTSNSFSVPTVPAAPALFTLNGSGTGPGAILNQDNSYNTPDTPAPKGSYVVLYLTGEGQTSPAGVTGKVTTVSATPPLTPQPVLPVSVTIDGLPAGIAFYGEAPGLVSGVLQINAQVPPAARSGNVPVTVSIGGNTTPAGVTVSVR